MYGINFTHTKKFKTLLYILFTILAITSICVGVKDFSIYNLLLGEKDEIFLALTSRIPRTLSIVLNGICKRLSYKFRKNIWFRKKAKEKIAQLDIKVEETKNLIKKSKLKALVILTNDGSISAFGKNSRFGIVHDLLDVIPADDSITVSRHGQEIDYEYISKINPDIIYFMDRTVVVGGSKYASDTLSNSLVNQTNAAKNNKFLPLDPTSWYLSPAGFNSTIQMLNDVAVAYK